MHPTDCYFEKYHKKSAIVVSVQLSEFSTPFDTVHVLFIVVHALFFKSNYSETEQLSGQS
jgi:hypothetical protein